MADKDWEVIEPPKQAHNDDWEPVTTPAPVQSPTQPPVQSQGAGNLSTMWHALSDPWTDAPSKFMHGLGDKLNSTANEQGPLSLLKGYAAGAYGAVGDLASSMTSPISLAMTLASGGEYGAVKAGLPEIANALRFGTKALSVPFIAHGAEETLNPQSTLGQRGMGLAEMAGGAMGIVHAPAEVTPKPTINPSIVENVKAQKPGLMSDVRDMMNEIKGGKPAIVQDNSIGGMVGRIHDNENALTDFNNSRVAKTLPREGDDVEEMIKGLGDHPDSFEVISEPTVLENNGSGESSASVEAINRQSQMKTNGQQYVVYDKAGNERPIIGPDAVDYKVQPGETYGIKNADGSFQKLDDAGGRVPTAPSKTTQFLERDLQGAKPRFSIGSNSYLPEFESDLDKAMFIIAQKTPSRRDADFLRFVMEQTGLDEAGARQAGQAVKARIKEIVSGEEPGTVKIPAIHGKKAGPIVQPSVSEPSAIYIKRADPEVIKQVMEKGYVFDSMRDDGAFKMVKSDKPPTNLPVLESQINKPGVAPTPANAARMAAGGGPPITPTGKSVTSGGKGPGGKPIKPPSKLHEIYNFPRTVMASLDFSAPLRQGLGLVHKKQFWTSLDDMVRAWGSERAYNSIQQSILEKPMFKSTQSVTGKPRPSFAEQAGVKLTDLHSLSTREENMMSTWADKVPGVRRSNRAYTAFLNKLRADTFEDLITRSKVFGADATVNLPLAREIAEFVNTASGRGSLGKLEKSAVALNGMLFSPRLIASRVKMLNPGTYIFANPTVRKEYLKSLFAIGAVGTTVGQLGKLAGGEVSNDPNSADFGKVKIGNVRLDPYGGFQQYIVAANRLMRPQSMGIGEETDTGIVAIDQIMGLLSHGGQQVTSSTTGKISDLNNPKGPYDPTHMDILTRFGRGKLHPVLGFVASLLMGQKELNGQKMDLSSMNPMQNSIAQRFVPIVLQDLISIAEEDPSLLPILGSLTVAGMGNQVYGSDK
jgi:hypothetical protein